jgi:hypothetical protein
MDHGPWRPGTRGGISYADVDATMLPPRSHHRLATVAVAFIVIVLYFRSLILTITTITIVKNRTVNEFYSQTTWEQQQLQLPQWLNDYFHWHNSMRHQYPGLSLFTHPDSPGVLIKSCAHKCGGLHDRFGGLGWDLYLANQTKRVLLIHWCIPAPIEYYLVPNVVDWTLPRNDNDNIDIVNKSPGASYSKPTTPLTSKGELEEKEKKKEEFILDDRLFSNTTETHVHCDRAIQSWPGLFDGYSESRPGAEFWESQIDLALHRAIHGEYANHTILRFQILGFDEYLEKRLRERHGEMDVIAWTDSFSTMFWKMFRPSMGLQEELDAAFIDLGLLPKTASSSSMGKNSTMMKMTTTTSSPPLSPFYAIHVRIRHPRGHVSISMKGNPDKFGLEWEDGPTRDFATHVSDHAFHCAQERALLSVIAEHRSSNATSSTLLHTVIEKPTAYVFFADSEELVTHMGNEYHMDGLRVRNIMGREVVHIDRQQEMSPESYYDSFIDLFVAAQASCVQFFLLGLFQFLLHLISKTHSYLFFLILIM